MQDKVDFGEEMALLHTALMAEIMRRQQESIIMKGDLPFSCIMVLDALKELGSMTMSEIALALNVSMGAATGIVDKLIEKGMVKRERDSQDRRVVRVELEKAGRKAAEDVYRERVDISNDFYSVLDAREKEEMLRMFKKVYNSVKDR